MISLRVVGSCHPPVGFVWEHCIMAWARSIQSMHPRKPIHACRDSYLNLSIQRSDLPRGHSFSDMSEGLSLYPGHASLPICTIPHSRQVPKVQKLAQKTARMRMAAFKCCLSLPRQYALRKCFTPIRIGHSGFFTPA